MDSVEMPVVDNTPLESKAEALPGDNTKASGPTMEAPKPGPAEDVRQIQQLLVMGIYPGQMAPQVVRSYQYLEALAKKIEADVPK